MSAPEHARGDDTAREAARWAVRRDRGLSATESIEYELWLAADPLHGVAMGRAAGAWARLDHVPEGVARRVVEDGRRRRRWWRVTGVVAPLGAAAAVALVFRFSGDGEPERVSPRIATSQVALQAAGPRQVALADGTEVRLNGGAEIVERFSAATRGVELTRGEAHFTVTKDPARPFVVSAGALRVRAIGTAFNVSRQEARTEVLVTEGRVSLLASAGNGGNLGATGKPEGSGSAPSDRAPTEPSEPSPMAELSAGERAVVTIAEPRAGGVTPDVAVARVDAAEISRVLAWQENVLRLGGATLAEIAAEFERRTGHRVVLADPELAQVRLGGRFRADDVEGFAKLLTAMLDVEAQRGADGVIVLRKKN